MSGLLAALELRRAGWDADVYERVESELSGRGAGIVAQPELIDRIRRLGIEPAEFGVAIQGRKIFDAAGGLVCTGECPQVLAAWEGVYRLLRDAFPPAHYHRGRAVARSASTGRVGGRALRRRRARSRATCWSAADGIRSTIRQQCLPGLTPLYAGYAAWRALIPEAAFPPDIHRELFEYMSFCLPPGEQFLGYPVTGPDDDLRPGHRRYNVVWYRPADEATELRQLLTDDARHGARHLDSAAADPARRDRRRCAPPPSGCWRRSSAPWCG